MCLCVRECVCARVCMFVCVRARVRACMHVSVPLSVGGKDIILQIQLSAFKKKTFNLLSILNLGKFLYQKL